MSATSNEVRIPVVFHSPPPTAAAGTPTPAAVAAATTVLATPPATRTEAAAVASTAPLTAHSVTTLPKERTPALGSPDRHQATLHNPGVNSNAVVECQGVHPALFDPNTVIPEHKTPDPKAPAPKKSCWSTVAKVIVALLVVAFLAVTIASALGLFGSLGAVPNNIPLLGGTALQHVVTGAAGLATLGTTVGLIAMLLPKGQKKPKAPAVDQPVEAPRNFAEATVRVKKD